MLSSVVPSLRSGAPATGFLTIRDEYTGRILSQIGVTPIEVTGEETRYSSGDVLSSNGEVLGVRFGTYVGTVKTGSLWLLPLRNGARGSAQITFDKLDGIGRFDWSVVRQDARTACVEVEVYLPLASSTGAPWCLRDGSWSAQYGSDMPLPTTSKLAVNTACQSFGGQERIVTDWQPKP